MAIIMGILATALATAPAGAAPAVAQVLPTVYEAGHFYAVPETADGQKLKLLADTGGGGFGGMYWISKAAAARLHLKPVACASNGEKLPVAHLPDYKSGQGLPAPGDGPCTAGLLVFPSADNTYSGQLGAGYFPGRVWTFDYPSQRLMLEGDDWRAARGMHPTPLGFPHNAKGVQTAGFARITIRVDGQPLDMLLDSGASSYPTPAAVRISGTPTVHGEGVASYITTSMLEHWHKVHPGWRIVKNADYKVAAKPLRRIIEVPEVDIAGWSVGPVWFTEQPDHAYRVWMASMMDKPVEGAVGANVFQHFVMTLDYPHETAWFRCVTGCKPVTTPPPAP